MFKKLKFFHKLIVMNTLPMLGLMFLSTITFWITCVFLEEFKTAQNTAYKITQAYEYIYENKPYKFKPIISSPFEFIRAKYMNNYYKYKNELNQELKYLSTHKDIKVFNKALLNATRIVIDENIKNIFLDLYEDKSYKHIQELKHISNKSLNLFYGLFWFFLLGGLISVGSAMFFTYMIIKNIYEEFGDSNKSLDEIIKYKLNMN